MKTKFFLSALSALTAGAFSSCSQTPAKEAVLWLGWDSDVIKGPVLQAEYVMEDEDGGTVAHEICYFDADGHIVRQEGKHQYATPLLERVYDGDFCCKETTTDRDGKVEVILFESPLCERNRLNFKRLRFYFRRFAPPLHHEKARLSCC